MGPSNKKKFFFTFFLLEVLMIPQEDKNYVRSKNFPRKSGLVPGFTTILKCTPECDGIVVLHTDGKALQEEISFALISGYRLLSATSMMQHKCGPLWHPRPCIFQQTRE